MQEATGQDRPPRAVLLNDTRIENHHGCDAVVTSMFRLASDAGLEVSTTAPANADWRTNAAVMAAIDDADLVIVNGEGTLHHDAPWGEVLLAAGAYARARGKAAVLINATWQENSARLGALVKDFDLVSVRETASARALEAIGVDARIVPDLALLEDIPSPHRGGGLGFSDNVVRSSTLALYRHMKAHAAEPISLFRRSPTWREVYRGLREFLPGFRIFNPFSVWEVLTLLRRDASAREPDGGRWKARVASYSLIVTGRFHLVAFCLASRTPFLAVASNTHKIAAMLSDAGLGGRHVAVDALTAEALSSAAVWRETELEAIEGYLGKARDEMRRLFRDIRRLALEKRGGDR